MQPPEQLSLDNPLWQASLALWSNARVAESCLQLQSAGYCVSRILTAIWLAAEGISWDGAEPEAIQEWRKHYTETYRHLRMGLIKNNPASSALRKQTQAAELEAEKIELAWIFHGHATQEKRFFERNHLDGGHILANTRYNAELLIANLNVAAPDVSASLQSEHGMTQLTNTLLEPGRLAEQSPSPAIDNSFSIDKKGRRP